MKESEKKIFKSVDEYIASLPENAGEMIQSLRTMIKKYVPDAEETISYNMPAFRMSGILCYYAAHRGHIGFYPASAKAILAFKKELEAYRTSKGTVQFPIGTEIPEELVNKIIRYRIQEKEVKVSRRG